jgi:AcrR family transcriptional regulator
MKLLQRTGARDRTRRAILEAMADVIGETNGIGFSVQAVANRAGVTHRTIYNHFPTREALCQGFSDYVDELLASSSGAPPPTAPSIAELPAMTGGLYKLLAQHERHTRAYVMLMIGNRGPLKNWRGRTRSFELQIAKQAGAGAPIAPHLAAAAIRMFVSTMGWHLLTEQCGLSTDEAAATSAWATQTLLAAATGSGGQSAQPSRPSLRGKNATRRRRN